MRNDTTPLVDAISKIHIEGHIIPHSWYQAFKMPSGIPDLNAMVILADVIYWYRRSPIYNEDSTAIVGYRKKFKGDLLQRSYKQLKQMFGLTEKQCKDAIKRLVAYGALERIFRDITLPDTRILRNVMFLKPVVEGVLRATYSTQNNGPTSPPDEPPNDENSNEYDYGMDINVHTPELKSTHLPTLKSPRSDFNVRHTCISTKTSTKNINNTYEASLATQAPPHGAPPEIVNSPLIVNSTDDTLAIETTVPDSVREEAPNPPVPRAPLSPKTKQSKADPRSGHAAIQAFRGITGKYPNKALYDDIIAALGEEADLERLRLCYKEWLGCGFNPIAITWATQWYLGEGMNDFTFKRLGRPQEKGRQAAAKIVFAGIENDQPQLSPEEAKAALQAAKEILQNVPQRQRYAK